MDLEILKMISSIGSSGLVAWLFIRTFNQTIPSLVKDFRAEQDASRIEHANTIKEIVGELVSMRKTIDKILLLQTAQILKRTDATPADLLNLLTEDKK